MRHPTKSHNVRATLSSSGAQAARYRSRNTDKSDNVTINETEEGARERERQEETVTARGEVTSVPRVSAGLLEEGCGSYSLRVWARSVPDSLSTVPLSLRGGAWVSTYMQICILNIDIDRVPTACVYCVTFDSQWRTPPPVDTAPKGRGESLGAINNPPASSSAGAQ